MIDQKTIMYDSNEAAQLKTVTGWVSSDGRFWGADERAARYAGSTHHTCECGKIAERAYTVCQDCRAHNKRLRYEALPFQEWDGNVPVFCDLSDKYFFSEDDLIEYLEENDLTGNDLMLLICDPQRFGGVDEDTWSDVLPEDWTLRDASPELEKKITELNEFIATLPPASWYPGKVRTSYTYKPDMNE